MRFMTLGHDHINVMQPAPNIMQLSQLHIMKEAQLKQLCDAIYQVVLTY